MSHKACLPCNNWQRWWWRLDVLERNIEEYVAAMLLERTDDAAFRQDWLRTNKRHRARKGTRLNRRGQEYLISLFAHRNLHVTNNYKYASTHMRVLETFPSERGKSTWSDDIVLAVYCCKQTLCCFKWNNMPFDTSDGITRHSFLISIISLLECISLWTTKFSTFRAARCNLHTGIRETVHLHFQDKTKAMINFDTHGNLQFSHWNAWAHKKEHEGWQGRIWFWISCTATLNLLKYYVIGVLYCGWCVESVYFLWLSCRSTHCCQVPTKHGHWFTKSPTYDQK